MLNNDDATVRELARASLLLDLRKRKVIGSLAVWGAEGVFVPLNKDLYHL
jgi:hypothetical protein